MQVWAGGRVPFHMAGVATGVWGPIGGASDASVVVGRRDRRGAFRDPMYAARRDGIL